MSVRVMSLVWDSTVPAPERFTLLALADRADEDGVCWPSIPTLARKCCTGESTIRRHLRALVNSGVVSSTQRPNTSSMYRINLGRLRALAHPSQSDTPCQIDTPYQSDRGVQSDTPPQIDRAPSQSGTTPPPRLGGPPSQSERLSISDPSVDPSEIHQGASRKRDRAAKATRLPDDFTVTAEMVAWARANVSHVDGRRETEKFIDHFRAASGPNARKTDWVAAWRNWMRKADDFGPTQGTGGSAPRRRTTDDKRAAIPGLVAEVLGNGNTSALRPDLRAITGGGQ